MSAFPKYLRLKHIFEKESKFLNDRKIMKINLIFPNLKIGRHQIELLCGNSRVITKVFGMFMIFNFLLYIIFERNLIEKFKIKSIWKRSKGYRKDI